MEQMMECLIAAIGGLEAMIRNNQTKVGASLKEMREKMLAKMETHEEKMNASQVWTIPKMDARIEEMKVWQKENGLPRSDGSLSGESGANLIGDRVCGGA
jgi:hypothetical protein